MRRRAARLIPIVMTVALVTPAGLTAQSAPATFDLAQAAPSAVERAPAPSMAQAAAPALPLTLAEAIRRALDHNLAAVVDRTKAAGAAGSRLEALSALLPHLSIGVRQSDQVINTAAFGFSAFGSAAGFSIPSLIGPFAVFDARLSVTTPLLDFAAMDDLRAGRADERAAQADYRQTRETVILAAGNLYLEAVSDAARVASARSEVATATALADLAEDRRAAGLAAGVDVLRQRVQLESARARLITAENDLAKRKLQLGHAIGLPASQTVELSDSVEFTPAPELTLDMAAEAAMAHRDDLVSARARVDAARARRAAATARRLPSLHVDGDVGALGPSASTAQRTFTVAVNLHVPVFEGGLTRAKVEQTDAVLQQREAEFADLTEGVRYDIAMALLDVKAAAAAVQVAQNAEALARTELEQTQDRFRAGVASSVELTEAQESVSRATEQRISSIYAHTIAKALVARAMGEVEERFVELVEGRQR